MTGPTIVSPRIAAYALDCGFTRESMYSRHNGMVSHKPSSSSSLVLYFIPDDTPYQNEATSQTLVNWKVSDSGSKSWMFSRELFPDAGLGEETKRFTSGEFTLFSIPLFTDSPLSRVLSCPFSSSVKPNCSHQFETAPQILSWFTERMIRNKSSVFEASALKCMVSFPFSVLRIPQLNALALVKTGWHLSLNRCTIWDATESHFLSRGYFAFPYHHSSSPGPKNVQCPCENFFAYVLTLSEFEIQISSFLFCVQSISLNIDMKMIRSVNLSGSIFWRICNDVNPWKYSTRIQLLLHRFPTILFKRADILNSSTWLFHLVIASALCDIFPDTVRNLSRHVLLPLSTGSLHHETTTISSMIEMYFQYRNHSQNLFRMFPDQFLCDIE